VGVSELDSSLRQIQVEANLWLPVLPRMRPIRVVRHGHGSFPDPDATSGSADGDAVS
jgi:hypothetical protein